MQPNKIDCRGTKFDFAPPSKLLTSRS